MILLGEALALLPPLGIALYVGERDFWAFVVTIIIIAPIGVTLARTRVKLAGIGYREGFFIATGGWFLVAFFGSLPFMFSGTIPNFFDAFFESTSGFTTTGATVLTDIEALSRSMLFWRSFTHWLGGMGVIVLTLALIPSLKISGMKLFKAEVPGPTKSKVLPRVAQTSRELYKIYLIITLAEIGALKLVGLDWFDALIHTFGSVATAGFSSYNASIAALQNPAAEMIITFFMFICGLNFALHYYSLRGNLRPLWLDPESRLYFTITILAMGLIGFNLMTQLHYDAGSALRLSAFQTVSIITTTGFATTDYNHWPVFSQGVLFLLMFIGGCAGSTSGGIKHVRYLILFKTASRQIMKLLHPKAVVPVRIGGDIIPEDLVESVLVFFFLYFVILLATTMAITAMGVELFTALSAVIATLGNIGPGFGPVGPVGNYALIPGLGKLLLSLCMLVGRLEIYTVLVALSARFWKA